MPRQVTSIPRSTSQTVEKEWNDYSKGMNGYLGNDVIGERLWRLAQDARIVTLGEYSTRKGEDFLSDAAGEAQDNTVSSTTGAADKSFNQTTWLAQKSTTSGAGRCTKVTIRLKNDATATGVIKVALYSDNAGSPGTLLATSSIAQSSLTSSYAYVTARFNNAPSLSSATAYWIVAYSQTTSTGSYKWSSTTSATTAKTSADSGLTWSSTSYALNFTLHLATDGGTKGMFVATKNDGTKTVFMAHGTSLYTVNNSTGALTAIKTGLNSAASRYRFAHVNDILYYVNEFDGLRKWNYSAESQVSATNYSNIIEHKGALFLNETVDRNKWVFSNFADYETFTSTDFFYVPSPKTGDPSVAAASLNGALTIWTRLRKFILYGDDNATYQLSEAPATARKGTFTQETVTTDGNYAYFLSDDGVYKFNGATDELISESDYESIRLLDNKNNAVLNFNKGRVRMYYTPAGAAQNQKCYVWNVTYSTEREQVLESIDTDTYVGRAQTSPSDKYALIVASSLVGQVKWQELDTNDYNNLGGDINFELRTHYLNFGSSSREKEIRYWKPRFEAQSGNYKINCEYGFDLRDNPAIQSQVGVQGSGYLWGDSGTVWGSFTWGTSAELQSDLSVPGQYRRIQLRYKHYAARQPHSFLGHTIRAEIRDMR